MERKKWLIPAAAALAVIVIAAVILLVSRNKPEDISEVSADDITVEAAASGVTVVSLDSVSGAFVEDGSDENVENVLCAVFENDADKALQYAKLVLTIDGEEYIFEVSTIPAGAQVQALEINRKQAPESVKECSLDASNTAWFDSDPSLCSDVVELTAQNNAIIVKNISGSTINAPLYVYYKNCVENMFVGGITYRACTQEPLEPGQSAAIYAEHFYPESSQLMFVTYVP